MMTLVRFRLLCRAGSSPQVVLLTDIAMEADQKTAEHSNSQRRSPSEAPESQLHEPSTPGKHQALQSMSSHVQAPLTALKHHMLA